MNFIVMTMYPSGDLTAFDPSEVSSIETDTEDSERTFVFLKNDRHLCLSNKFANVLAAIESGKLK